MKVKKITNVCELEINRIYCFQTKLIYDIDTCEHIMCKSSDIKMVNFKGIDEFKNISEAIKDAFRSYAKDNFINLTNYNSVIFEGYHENFERFYVLVHKKTGILSTGSTKIYPTLDFVLNEESNNAKKSKKLEGNINQSTT